MKKGKSFNTPEICCISMKTDTQEKWATAQKLCHKCFALELLRQPCLLLAKLEETGDTFYVKVMNTFKAG